MSEVNNDHHRVGDEVQTILDEARRHATHRSDHQAALALNREALAKASNPFEEVQCRRWLGVSLYYLERLNDSEPMLEEALRLSRHHGFTSLIPYLHNHLGATYRRQGRLDEALHLFQEGLQLARRREAVRQRARLLGNLGALWDELGQRERAADAYARYEELSRLVADGGDEGDQGRLINALGLAGRAARQRGDLDYARARLEEAQQLAKTHGINRYDLRFAKHSAELRLSQIERELRHNQGWRPDDWEIPYLGDSQATQLREAISHYEDALGLVSKTSETTRKISLLRGQAQAALLLGDVRTSHGQLCDAWGLAQKLNRGEEIANVAEDLARTSAAAGLLGEAMWYLKKAITTRTSLYERLPGPEIKVLAAPRLHAIQGLTARLTQLAQRVDLTAQETATIGELRKKVGLLEDVPPSDALVRAQTLAQVREQSRRRWRRLLGPIFDRASAQTQTDLIRADVVYHGAVDDLGRSAHLLTVVVERELRTLITEIYRQANTRPDHAGEAATSELRDLKIHGLGGILCEIMRCLTMSGKPKLGPEAATRMVEQLGPHVALFNALSRAFNQEANLLDGKAISISNLRNTIAHGDATLSLSRLSVDVIRRTLVLGPTPLLKGLLELSTPPVRPL